MTITIREVKSKKDLRTFIFLPSKLHKSEPDWIPPVYMDDKIYFNPKKNKSFSYCDTILLLAYKNKTAVGRIMGVINHRYNELSMNNNARFIWMEGQDNEVLSALLETMENWAKEKGAKKIVGPFGFSDKDPQGYLIEGFEHKPVIITNYNTPELITFLEERGYSKEVDLFAYKVDVPCEIPLFYTRIQERVVRNGDFNLLEFKSRRKLKPYIRPIFGLVNETFNEIYGFIPFEKKEMDDFASRYLPVIDPAFVKVVMKQDEPVAFIIGMPDISEGIKKSKGYVIPFGIFKIWKSQKETKRLVLLLGAVKQEYRGRGLDVLMGSKMIESALEKGYDHIDSHLELEENEKVRAEMEKMGGVAYKKFRIFKKSL
ncbi:MAG: hypothetical protein HOG05_02465 [Bacteroidetes bacterium]|nr:hypothetical protein [Bacteroidota bacterium]MBT3799989.1 hypothetical protein [Bacteroidota bacterium]MBT4729543.1 hypothetical protein [Bacteroidota bacterium]MBT5530306.1 hypothetical protein [Cytophagia bacterium]MBT5990385.1 hypothetical protein [Bacteroidota bacterium]